MVTNQHCLQGGTKILRITRLSRQQVDIPSCPSLHLKTASNVIFQRELHDRRVLQHSDTYFASRQNDISRCAGNDYAPAAGQNKRRDTPLKAQVWNEAQETEVLKSRNDVPHFAGVRGEKFTSKS